MVADNILKFVAPIIFFISTDLLSVVKFDSQPEHD